MSSDFDQLQGCFYNLVEESTEVIVLFQANRLVPWLEHAERLVQCQMAFELRGFMVGQYNLKTRNKKSSPSAAFLVENLILKSLLIVLNEMGDVIFSMLLPRFDEYAPG